MSKSDVYGMRAPNGVSNEFRSVEATRLKRASQMQINAYDGLDIAKDLTLGRAPVFSKEAKERWKRERSTLIDISKY